MSVCHKHSSTSFVDISPYKSVNKWKFIKFFVESRNMSFSLALSFSILLRLFFIKFCSNIDPPLVGKCLVTPMFMTLVNWWRPSQENYIIISYKVGGDETTDENDDDDDEWVGAPSCSKKKRINVWQLDYVIIYICTKYLK